MSALTKLSRPYLIKVIRPRERKDELVFTFTPHKSPDYSHEEFVVSVHLRSEMIDWSHSPDQPGESKDEIDMEIRKRLQARSDWITLVQNLATQIENWAIQADWSTKRIPFTLDDSEIGKHTLPAVLMQKSTCRVLLEPVSRSSPGANGVVDLYLLPAYDDIASIYYYNNHWNLHYMFDGAPTVGNIQDAAAIELTAENLLKVLSEMEQNAD